ncbi:hypothetical protein [Dyadobacter sp. CY356]|uniref:hypothetical protein n=1 Tax=Dyadobacter sp. CY356 TaxID=2906442 RepID=UPI001F2E071A|nr:hypothetical protein [Dyadobacter sp. CY356]MCF0059227.1 hypothetical protein [Dyadobacter sp. CY356]
MEAVLKIKSSEFTDELISKIRALLSVSKDSEVTISITDKISAGILREESREEYFSRLDKSIDDFESGNIVSFNGDSFEKFVKHISQE